MYSYPLPEVRPNLVVDAGAFSELEQQLQELEAEFRLREVELTFKKDRYFFGDVRSAGDVYAFIRDSLYPGLEVQEHFVALFLNQANKIIGYYHHSMGTINSTQVDVEVLSATAVKILAKSVIIAHNHPSGNLRPSEADRQITQRIKKALAYFDIALLDHLIVTPDGYYSFADHSESSLGAIDRATPSALEGELRQAIFTQLQRLSAANSPALFGLIASRTGYLEAEALVLQKVIAERLPPAAAIPLIEQEMDMP